MHTIVVELVVGTGEDLGTELKVDQETEVESFVGEAVAPTTCPLVDSVAKHILIAGLGQTILQQKLAVGIALVAVAHDFSIRLTDNLIDRHIAVAGRTAFNGDPLYAVTKVLHLTVVVSEVERCVPCEVLGLDRISIDHELETVVVDLTNVGHL